ncbi:hypothetical protein DMJ13_03550 [halophilic archaeon]|nr:hypothetical protein DMJ13_03550 [halophilic archaeon]
MTGERTADDVSRDWMVHGADGDFVEQYDEDDVLAVLKARSDKAEPMTAQEISDQLGRSRSATYTKAMTLVEAGVIQSKKTGARGRVFWIPLYGQREGDTHN